MPLEWILNNIPLLIVFFVIYSIVKAVRGAQRQSEEHTASHDESAEQRRVREIQERIRRIAAERRGEAPSGGSPPPLRPEPASRTAGPVPPLEPFGGPLRRVVVELERRVQAPVPPPPAIHAAAAEAERQEQLEMAMRQIEESKILADRRAAKLDARQRADAGSEAGQRVAAREQLLRDLAGRESLRRAFVLREVLGTPVGLR